MFFSPSAFSQTRPGVGRRLRLGSSGSRLSTRHWLGVVFLVVLTLFASAFPAAAADDGLCGRRALIVLGVPGLRWDTLPMMSQLSHEYPRLAQAINVGSSANLVDRAGNYRSCPIDAWGTLSAGRRVALSARAENASDCQAVPAPEADGEIPGFSGLGKKAIQSHADSQLGALGQALAKAKIRVAAVGNGAALALANQHGKLEGTFAEPAQSAQQLGKQVAKLTDDHELVMVDLGASLHPDDRTNTAVVLAKIEAIFEAAPNNANIVLVGISDGATAARLQVFTAGSGVMRDPCAQQLAPAQPNLARTASTHVDGLVQISDLTATILRFFQVDPFESLQGQEISPGSVVSSSSDDKYAVAHKVKQKLADRARHAAASRTSRGPYAFALTALAIVFTLLIPYLWIRRAKVARADSEPVSIRKKAVRRLRLAYVFGLFVASYAIFGFLINAFPWWRIGPSFTEDAHLAFSLSAVLLCAVLAAVLTGLALLVSRFWPRPWVAPVVVAATGFVALTLDPIFHLGLATDSPIALSTVFGARFYGIGNTHFAIWVGAALFLTALAATFSLRKYRKVDAIAVLVGAIVLLVIVDGTPGWGTDFGGPPAIIIGFTVLSLAVFRIRITWKRILLVVLISAGLGFVALFVDWLRGPEHWSHLGRFFQQILDGQALDVISGKLTSILFADGWGPLAVAGLTALIVAFAATALYPLWYSRRKHDLYGWLHPQGAWAAKDLDDSLRPLLLGWIATMIVATAINDSLWLIPLISYAFIGPLAVSFIALLLENQWDLLKELES